MQPSINQNNSLKLFNKNESLLVEELTSIPLNN